MSDLLQEFEDDMRRERSEAMWKGFGKYVVWLSIAIVLGTASGVSWRYYQKTQNEKQTAQLLRGQRLIQSGEYKQATQVLEDLAKNSNENMYSLAMLHKAQAHSLLNDKEAVKATYAELAGRKGDTPYIALAELLAAGDSTILPEPKKDQPFYYSKMAWRGWQLYAAGKKDEAVSVFTTLYDDTNTPQSMRGRIAESLQIIAPATLLPKPNLVAVTDEK